MPGGLEPKARSDKPRAIAFSKGLRLEARLETRVYGSWEARILGLMISDEIGKVLDSRVFIPGVGKLGMEA